MKLHKEKLKNVLDDFMRAKYRVNDSLKSVYDPKRGGLVSVAEIIEEIKEKEENAKQEQREKNP